MCTQQKIEELQACKSNTWHLFHFIMTIIFIPWIVIWAVCAWINNRHNKNIDAYIIMDHNDSTDTDIED